VAYEVLICTPAIRSIVREGKTHQIYSNIQSGAKYGMITLDANLKDQYLKGLINLEDAIAKSSNPHEFEKLLGKT